MIELCRPHVSEDPCLEQTVDELTLCAEGMVSTGSLPELVSVEGRAWSVYCNAFNIIIKHFQMGPRQKWPPDNPVNALISMGKSILYAAMLTQLYHTQPDPSISYPHESMNRRFSLSLDMAEVFKPYIVDPLIFRVLNLKVIRAEHFNQELNSCLLNDEGRRLFIAAVEERLRNTVRHSRLKKKGVNRVSSQA